MAATSGIIGRGTVIKGNVSGSGDVVVQGRVEGTVALKDQLSIEPEGKVFADVEVENLEVHGEMSGDINAGDRVLIAATAKVVGDIKAPRVVIQDGARFKGSIEMDMGDLELPRGERPAISRPAARPALPARSANAGKKEEGRTEKAAPKGPPAPPAAMGMGAVKKKVVVRRQ